MFLLLAMLTSEAFSWWGRCRRRRRYSSSSSSDSSNSRPVVCYFYRSSNRITCTKGGVSATCGTVSPSQTRDDRFGGPTPLGEYLIGKRYNIDWYNLYPKKEDNSCYYQRTRKGRYAISLHPGTRSLGCVTVVKSCWPSIRSVVDSGNQPYCGSYYSGYLFVKW